MTECTNRAVAIDGPAASGKSTVSRRIAAELGYLYVDSGALYRAVTWRALRNNVDPRDRDAVASMLPECDFQFFVEDGAVCFTVDGVRPGMELRGKDVNDGVSHVAAMPEVRKQVVTWLRDMVRFGSVVMEGRDIGTAVFPEAPHKVYLDANPEERARRRHQEMVEQAGDAKSVDEVGESLRRRDVIDSTRKTDPLKIAADAMVIDSTGVHIDEVVQRILSHITGTPGA